MEPQRKKRLSAGGGLAAPTGRAGGREPVAGSWPCRPQEEGLTCGVETGLCSPPLPLPCHLVDSAPSPRPLASPAELDGQASLQGLALVTVTQSLQMTRAGLGTVIYRHPVLCQCLLGMAALSTRAQTWLPASAFSVLTGRHP